MDPGWKSVHPGIILLDGAVQPLQAPDTVFASWTVSRRFLPVFIEVCLMQDFIDYAAVGYDSNLFIDLFELIELYYKPPAKMKRLCKKWLCFKVSFIIIIWKE